MWVAAQDFLRHRFLCWAKREFPRHNGCPLPSGYFHNLGAIAQVLFGSANDFGELGEITPYPVLQLPSRT